MVKLVYVVISACRSVLADTETTILSMVKHRLVKMSQRFRIQGYGGSLLFCDYK